MNFLIVNTKTHMTSLQETFKNEALEQHRKKLNKEHRMYYRKKQKLTIRHSIKRHGSDLHPLWAPNFG